MRRTLLRISTQFIALTLCSTVAVFSCRHGDKKKSATNSASENLADPTSNPNNLTHPQTANEYATRIYVSTVPQQPAEKIAECIEQITAIGKESANQDDMKTAVIATQSLFAQNLPLYHNCFYQLAARLDNRLAQGGPLVSELAHEFFETTQAMWIMAKALDRVTGKKAYYSYLKQRYVQISQDVFGRHVAPLGDAFDEKKSPGGNIKQSNEKAAGPHKQ